MIFIFLTAPICLLCSYLAFICYKKSYYQHTIVLSLCALFMLIVTLGIIGISYSAWNVIEEELVSIHRLSGWEILS
jgi:hypothetical protein